MPLDAAKEHEIFRERFRNWFRRIIVKNDAGRPVLQTNREKRGGGEGPPPLIARISGVNRANFKRWVIFLPLFLDRP